MKLPSRSPFSSRSLRAERIRAVALSSFPQYLLYIAWRSRSHASANDRTEHNTVALAIRYREEPDAVLCVLGEGTPVFHAWLTESLHELKHGQPDKVLMTLQDMQAEASARGPGGEAASDIVA
jgi:hypothetical protein